MTTELGSIKRYTRVVADSGEFNIIAKYHPLDATTNPSLIKQACSKPQYRSIIDAAIAAESSGDQSIEARANRIIDRLTVLFGVELLKIVPGRVSSEIDASLSFNTDAMVNKCLDLINLYKEYGISSERVYFKLPATWEGIQAAKILREKDRSIHVNMTLVFNLAQAVACAHACADLVSPFVGRIYDFFKNKGMIIEDPELDPGVMNVRKIFSYYYYFGVKTLVMGASFRNVGQIKALCGVYALTISPSLLEELSNKIGDVKPFAIDKERPEKMEIDEKSFRYQMSIDEMATFKLQEGIELFTKDTELLRAQVIEILQGLDPQN